MSALRPQVLRGYRALLRSIDTVFRADAAAVLHCRGEARKAFRLNAAVPLSDTARIQALVDEAREATDFLHQNIAQARVNAAGRYGESLAVAPA